MTTAAFADSATALEFILGGNATFTIMSKRSAKRYTYKVCESDDGKVHFASAMFGSSNEDDFAYIGLIKNGQFCRTAKAKLAESDPRCGALAWAILQLNGREDIHPDMEVWHEGRCARCNRKLTDPVSIANGFGPECRKRMVARAA